MVWVRAVVLPPVTSAYQRWRRARGAFSHFAYAIADFFYIPRLTGENISEHVVEIRGQEYLEQAVRARPTFSGVGCGGWLALARRVTARGTAGQAFVARGQPAAKPVEQRRRFTR